MQRFGWGAAACALAAWAFLGMPGIAAAQSFYQGKTITILVGFSAGGTYDQQGRLYARHMGRYLPGNPNIIVQNMAGAGSLIATNNLYSVAPKDGTVLAIIGGGTVIEPLVGNPQAKYDARRFNWIGGRTPDNFLCLVDSATGVKTIDDLKTRETVVGATGPGSRTLNFPRALNELLGTKFKVVSGYPGGNEISLALERREVEGYCGWSVDSLNSRAPNLLPEGKVRAVAQFVIGDKGALPNIPIASQLPTTDVGRRTLELLSADSILAWPLVAPPDLPADRVAALRKAFQEVSKDPAFLEDAKKMALEVNPITGEELQKFVGTLYTASDEVIGLVKKIFAK